MVITTVGCSQMQKKSLVSLLQFNLVKASGACHFLTYKPMLKANGVTLKCGAELWFSRSALSEFARKLPGHTLTSPDLRS